VLLVWAAASFSVRDVTTGLRGALLRAGHAVRDYRLDNRLQLLSQAFPPELLSKDALSRMATECVLPEATYHQADVVLVVSGLWFHEIGLWLLQQHAIPTAVVLTESPYDDELQARWLARYPEAVVFTHERTSAANYNWHYLPHAYDPDIHRPVLPDGEETCDVLLVGTGFPERQRLLEGIDWRGIKLKLRGLWPGIEAGSPLAPFYIDGCVPNADLPRLYAATKIALNPYRDGALAESLNPRAYELAACGAFQVSELRAEATELFGDAVPTYRGSADLEALVRYYLAHPDKRAACATAARARVEGQTFDRRVADLMAVLEARASAAAA
jgi:spore maturation protein CgeB